LTQVELAKIAKTSQRAVSYYENEAGFPPASALIALAEALKVSTDELLGLKPRQPGHLEKSPELRRLWKKFQQVTKLPERDQRAVIRLINSLAAANQVTQPEVDHADPTQN
jgi:transcriptional regulator with XRE-family HTH domain